MSQETIIDKFICIGLLTKNCGSFIAQVLKNVETYASLFKDYKCLIIDGYSTDSTEIICKSWCNQSTHSNKRFFFHQRTKGAQRMQGITESRNMILDFFQNDFGENSYLLLLDADSPNATPLCSESKQAFLRGIQQPDWDVLFCNQSKKYYDLWALRDQELDEDYQLKFKGYSWNGEMQSVLKQFEVPKKGQDDRNFYPVRSAFGGAGIYKTEIIQKANAKYTFHRIIQVGDKQYTIQICEHVPFHYSIEHAGGNLFICCDWIIGEHL